MYIGSTYCDAAQWEYRRYVRSYRQRGTMAAANPGSGKQEEQEETQTGKLIVFAEGQTLI